MKKALIMSVVSTFILTASVAFGAGSIESNGDLGENSIYLRNKLEIDIDIDEDNDVDVESEASANTGKNEISSYSGGYLGFGGKTLVKNAWQKTGEALAESHVDTDTGTTDVTITVDGCDCEEPSIEDNGDANYNKIKQKSKTEVELELEIENEVEVESEAKANTGKNEIESESGGIFGDDALVKDAGQETGPAAGGSFVWTQTAKKSFTMAF